MLHAIDKLSTVPAYARVMRRYTSHEQVLKDEFRVYAAISQAFFVLFDHLQPLEGPAGENTKNRRAIALKKSRQSNQARSPISSRSCFWQWKALKVE